MKKKTLFSYIALASITAFGLIGTVFSTISWFVASVVTPEYKLDGSSAGAYFAYGDGTSDHPFGISIPRHLYNLSWLQYMGQFSDKQYYFELASSVPATGLDMTGYILPPIGTEDDPFVGNFKGNGKIITNLIVTNNESEIFSSAKHPDRTSVDYEAPEIVGLFGVVGNLNSAYTGTYVDSINTISNLGIKNIIVKSSTSNTLVGIAAGYVDGVLDNVAVNESSLYTASSASAITSITDCVSNYSLIGYCTKKHLGEMKLRSDDADVPTLENPNTVSGGDNWGGSINMLDMYTYLRGMCDTSTAYSFSTAETIYNNADGTSNTVVTSSATNSNYASNWSEYYRYEGNKVIEDDKEYAAFTFARSSGNSNFSSYNDNDTKYICLYGGTSKRGTTGQGTNATKTVTTITQSNTSFRIFYNGANYLSYRGSISNQTNTSYASTWNWEGSYLKTTYSNTTYYLNISNGSLACSTTKSTTWTYTQDKKQLYATVSGTTYYLQFSNNTWSVSAGGYYTIHDDTKNGYVNNGNSYYLSNLSDVATTRWGYGQKSTTTGYGYNDLSNTGQWIGWYNDSTYSAQCYSDSKYHYHLESGSATGTGKLVAVNGSTKYYMYHTGNGSAYFAGSTNSSLGDTFTISVDYPGDIGMGSFSTANNQATYYDTNPTYFPLTRDKDEETGEYTGSGRPDEKNTGYIVSGCNLTDSTQGPYGDIRVSRFNISDIKVGLSGDTTFSASRLEVVTRTCVRNDNGTYTDSDWTRISDEYNVNNSINNTLSSTFTNKKNFKTDLRLSKYKNSRAQLNGTLSSGSGYIYGLHFMDAAISTSHLVTAPNVIVLDGKTLDSNGKAIGSEYTNYQLPQDSIDFNLKDQGFINFFAGTYFTNNNTFFSLHTITRNNSNGITSIQEIKKIYAPASGTPSNDNPYVYSYDGNQPANSGNLVFDTSWITAPSMVNNAVYYFEIPVNAGEYALGSVSGKNGAYLMYLDIGAGAANYRDITTTEHVVTISQNTSFPLGIEFHNIVANTAWTNLNGGETACVKINNSTNAQQTLLFEYNNSILVVSTTGSNPPIMAEYQQEGISINKKVGETTSALTFSPPVSYTIVRDAQTMESYNIFTSSVTKELNETYTITGAKVGDQIQLSMPIGTSGFTSGGAATFSVSSGSASVTSAGLVTINGSGEVVITMAYSESKANVETWDSATTLIADDTEGTIFGFHLRDYNTPNLVTRYVYDGLNKIYTVYITATVDGEIEIDTLPPVGYTVKVIINNGNPITLTSTSTSTTSITIDV